MEISSKKKKKSDSFIIHCRSAGRHLSRGDDKTVVDTPSISWLEYIAIKSSELEKTGFNVVSALKALLI